MSRADRSQYAETVTSLSEGELQAILASAEPPVCLLGGWAVHLHVTDSFTAQQGRSYIGSRDIDIGLHVDPEWRPSDLAGAPIAETLTRIENGLGYNRGRFGFYQQFHRETGARLDDEEARGVPSHQLFRVDIDVIPDTRALDAFEEHFGFRPPAEPLLEPVFREETGDSLGVYVDWEVPNTVMIAPPAALGAMKVRAFPNRDESHKRLKDLADLHALLWYVTDYDEIKMAVRKQVTQADITAFESALDEDLYDRAASLIEVDATTVRQSIEQLLL
jgi:hypothetical protein